MHVSPVRALHQTEFSLRRAARAVNSTRIGGSAVRRCKWSLVSTLHSYLRCNTARVVYSENTGPFSVVESDRPANSARMCASTDLWKVGTEVIVFKDFVLESGVKACISQTKEICGLENDPTSPVRLIFYDS